MIVFEALRNDIPLVDALGWIPLFLNSDDPRPAAEQFDTSYAYGGGWRPFKGFTAQQNFAWIQYPGDPPLYPIAKAQFRDETIYVFPFSWVLVAQPDGSFEISRMD